MNIIDEFAKRLDDDQNSQLFRAVVTGNNGNQVYIKRTGQASADGQSYPKISGVTVVANDEVVVARLGGGFVVLGKIVR